MPVNVVGRLFLSETSLEAVVESPTTVAPKSGWLGVNLVCGMPKPDSATICGLPVTLS